MTQRALFRIAVKGFIFKDDRVLVLKKSEEEKRGDHFPEYDFDLPGGKVEKGENLQEALCREVKEETNLDVIAVKPLATCKLNRPSNDLIVVDFLCAWVGGEIILSHEHDSFEWLSQEELAAKKWGNLEDFAPAFEEHARLEYTS